MAKGVYSQSEVVFSTIVFSIILIFILIIVVMFVSGSFKETKTTISNFQIQNKCESLGGRCLTIQTGCSERNPIYISQIDYFCYLQRGITPIPIKAFGCEERNRAIPIQEFAKTAEERERLRGFSADIFIETSCYLV